MSKEDAGTPNPKGIVEGSGVSSSAAKNIDAGSYQQSDVLGIVDANSKNLLAIMNEMNKNIVNYISDNNTYILSKIDSSSKAIDEDLLNKRIVNYINGAQSDALDSLNSRIRQIESRVGITEPPVGDLGVSEPDPDDADGVPVSSSDGQFVSTGNLSQFVLDAINANNASLMSVLEASSKALVDMIGQTNLDLARDLTEREQRQLETLVRRKVSFPFHPIAEGVVLPDVVNPMSLDAAMNKLRELAPLNYDNYLTCLDTGTESYSDLPEVSCSTERHPQARLFHDFLQPYLRNVVLDIGCGPQPVPSYLADWPVENIVGIDPISAPEDHPFLFVSGIGEFLPFPDNSFGAVVSGTTLDHYYLLDLGLKEAFRVLEPGGHFVAWITEFEGAPEYDPYASAVKPYDHEHMYHIDRKWFLPMMQSVGFEVGEVIRFPLPFNYLFMSFRKPL